MLREVDVVSFIIYAKLRREDSREIDLFLLQKSGQMIFPGFQIEKMPANIMVKTEQQFQSYCRYFLSNFVTQTPFVEELTWEKIGREIFVFLSLEMIKTKPNFYFVTPAEIFNQKHYLGTCISGTVYSFLSKNLKKVINTEVFPQVFYLHVNEEDAIYFQNLPLERNKDSYFYFSSKIDKNKTNLRYAVWVGKYVINENIGEFDETCFKEDIVLVKNRKQFSLLF
jgi:hypothetical protein